MMTTLSIWLWLWSCDNIRNIWVWLHFYMTMYETCLWKISRCGALPLFRAIVLGATASISSTLQPARMWCVTVDGIPLILPFFVDGSICILQSLPYGNPVSNIPDTCQELVYQRWTKSVFNQKLKYCRRTNGKWLGSGECLVVSIGLRV